MSRPIRSAVALLSAALLAVSSSGAALAAPATPGDGSEAVTSSAAAAGTALTDDPAAAAAGWLAGQLVDGERIETTFDGVVYPDQGLTADVVFALASAGVAARYQERAADWLESQAVVYATPGDERYAGALAKLLVTAEVVDRDPTDFGGLDLVELLEEREEPDGRYVDETAWGDFSNTITQSLALIGLHRADGVSPSPLAVGYLVGQACEDGGFSVTFPDDDETGDCSSEADATAFAVQALDAVGAPDAAVDAAVDWLLDAQATDGSFVGDGGANSNSTGLAAVALEVGGETEAAARARAWVTGLQLGCAAAHPGAIPYNAEDPGDVVRATAQALPGLTGVDLAEVSRAGSSNAVPLLDCPLPRFADVAAGGAHAEAIGQLARRGILLGVGADRFEPRRLINRGQLASVVRRAAPYAEVPGTVFPDATTGPHVGSINALAEQRILTGYVDGSFRPLEPIRRDQVAVVLARWLELDPVGGSAFGDLSDSPHRRAVNALAEVGVARGDTSGRFRPHASLTREQLASFVWRAVQYREHGEVS